MGVLKKCTNNIVFIVLLIINLICSVTFYISTRYIEKPGTFKEVFKFLIDNPRTFWTGVLVGIICWGIWVWLLGSTITSIPIVSENLDIDTNSIILISKISTTIILFIANVIILKLLPTMILVVTVIYILVYAVFNDNK